MPVSQIEVDALKAEGEARGLDDADTTLETLAEQLGFVVYQLRHLGADRAEVLHDVELLVRAVELDRESIRTARDTLGALGYGADVTMLLTALARRAKPKTRWSGRTASAEQRFAQRRAAAAR
jgi:hypothetical protein